MMAERHVKEIQEAEQRVAEEIHSAIVADFNKI